MIKISFKNDEVKINNDDVKKTMVELRKKTVDPICMGLGAGMLVRGAVKVITGSDSLGDALGLIACYKTTVKRLNEAYKQE